MFLCPCLSPVYALASTTGKKGSQADILDIPFISASSRLPYSAILDIFFAECGYFQTSMLFTIEFCGTPIEKLHGFVRLVGAFDVGQQGVEFPDARGIDLRRLGHAMDEGWATLRQHVEALVPRPGLGPELHLLVTSGWVWSDLMKFW